jgi:hypothetical protein
LASRYLRAKNFGQCDVGEWLINYKGSFVRRGLFGELLLHLFNLNQPIAGLVLFLIQSLLIISLIMFLFKFMISQSFSFSSIALCCSPAVGLFISNNYGPTRKELLGIFSLILITLASRNSNRTYSVLSWISILMFGFSCFSSEINALLLPGFFFVLHISCTGLATPVKILTQKIAVVFLSFVGFGLSSFFHGNSNISKIICTDIVSHGFPPSTCSEYSSISALSSSAKDAMLALHEHFPLYLDYIPLILLAALPIVVAPWFRTYWRWCLACVFFTLPLYMFVTDYGRWTFMLATEISVMVIATKNAEVYNSVWNKFTTFIFIFGWGIPMYVDTYISDPHLNFIYKNNAFYVIGHFIFTVTNQVF